MFLDFGSPLIARARSPSNSPYMQFDWLEWRCPVWEDDAQPSMWIKSIYASLEEQRLQQVADSITLSEQHQAALQSKQAELDRLTAEYEALEAEFLDPEQKPTGFMRTPIGKTPTKPKTGWFNKMLVLLGACVTGDDLGVEQLVHQCNGS